MVVNIPIVTFGERIYKERAARSNDCIARLELEEGVIPVSNVLDAQTAWLSAHSQCVDAEIDLRLAHLYLDRATGKIGY